MMADLWQKYHPVATGVGNALSQYKTFLKDHWSTILKDPAQGFYNALSNTFSAVPSDRGVNALSQYLKTGEVPEDLPQLDMNRVGGEGLDLVFPIAGTIAGIGAKTAIPEAVDLARRLKTAGAADDEIFRRTTDEFGQGWWLGHPDTKPRFEIDDSQSALFVGDNPSTGPLSHYLGHEPLYKNYPDMELTGYAYRPGGSGGSYHPESDLMIVRSNDPGSAKSTTLHEGQHAVSAREGFARGGNPETAGAAYAAKLNNQRLATNEEFQDLAFKESIRDITPNESVRLEELRDMHRRIEKEISGINDYDAYRLLADESQARLTQSRMDMTAAERAAPGNEFYKKYDVPLNEMILRYDRGTNAMASLPMDEASRMQRAGDYPIEAYHGTNQDITEFSRKKMGGATRAKSAGKAFWFTDDAPTTASGYAGLAGENEVTKLVEASQAAERRGNWDAAHNLMVQAEELDQVIGKGENVMPVRLGGKMKVVDMEGAKYDPDDINLSKILDEAKEEGFEGVTFNNFSDESGYGVYNPVTHHAVFDPKNIRSRFAAFDPAKKDSANILAGAAGAGVALHWSDILNGENNALQQTQ